MKANWLVVLVAQTSLLLFCSNCVAEGGIIAFPQNVTIPVGSNGTFVCKSNSSIVWIVDQGSGNNILSANHNVPSLSFFNTSTGYTSTYTLSGEASNNITRVWCVSSYLELAHYLDNVNRPAVSLQLYGPPTPPEDVEAIPVDQGSKVKLSWSPSFSAFSTLTTYKVEISRILPMMDALDSAMSDSTSFIYTDTEPSCLPLNFSVYGVNGAGRSEVPATAIYNGFTKANIEPLVESLKHTITYVQGKISAFVSFKAPAECKGYPVTNYVLHLRSDSKSLEDYIWLSPSAELVFNISDISENHLYSYTIEAVNSINVISRTPKQMFTTTDVQSSAVTILETIATVSCTFISGSTCRGCYVEFKGKNSTTYMMVKLRRQEGQNMVTEKFAINFDAEDVVEVLTFDWEGNDSYGNVGISAQIHVEAVHASTVPTVEALGPKKGMGNLPVIATVVGGVVLLVISLVLLLSCFCGMYRKKRNRKVTVNDVRLNTYKPNIKSIDYRENEAVEKQLENTRLYHECGPPSAPEGDHVDPSTGNPIYDLPKFHEQEVQSSSCRDEDLLSSTYSQLRHSSCSHTSSAFPESHYSHLSQTPTYAVLGDELSSRASSFLCQQQPQRSSHYHSLVRPSSMSTISGLSTSSLTRLKPPRTKSTGCVKISAII